jgi:hypothetical protein
MLLVKVSANRETFHTTLSGATGTMTRTPSVLPALQEYRVEGVPNNGALYVHVHYVHF